jgi:hypothetical protein
LVQVTTAQATIPVPPKVPRLMLYGGLRCGVVCLIIQCAGPADIASQFPAQKTGVAY